MSADSKFDDIIQAALRKASVIPCSAEDYRAYLRAWADEIDMAINASAATSKTLRGE